MKLPKNDTVEYETVADAGRKVFVAAVVLPIVNDCIVIREIGPVVVPQVIVGVLAVAVGVVAHKAGLAAHRNIVAFPTEEFLVRSAAERAGVVSVHEDAVIVVTETRIVGVVERRLGSNRVRKGILPVVDVFHHEPLVPRCAKGNLTILRGEVEIVLDQLALLLVGLDVREGVPLAVNSDETALEDINHVLKFIPYRRELIHVTLNPLEFRLLHRPLVVPGIGMAENHLRAGLALKFKMGAENIESLLRYVGLEVVAEIDTEIVQGAVGFLAGFETFESVGLRETLGRHVLEVIFERRIRTTLGVAELVLVVFVCNRVLERRLRSLETLHLVLKNALYRPAFCRIEVACLPSVVFRNDVLLTSGENRNAEH